MIYCSNCGMSNRDGSRFCNECGQRLFVYVQCGQCGLPNASTARFCPHCGEQVTAAGEADPVAHRLPVSTSHRPTEAEEEGPLECDAPDLSVLLRGSEQASVPPVGGIFAATAVAAIPPIYDSAAPNLASGSSSSGPSPDALPQEQAQDQISFETGAMAGEVDALPELDIANLPDLASLLQLAELVEPDSEDAVLAPAGSGPTLCPRPESSDAVGGEPAVEAARATGYPDRLPEQEPQPAEPHSPEAPLATRPEDRPGYVDGPPRPMESAVDGIARWTETSGDASSEFAIGIAAPQPESETLDATPAAGDAGEDNDLDLTALPDFSSLIDLLAQEDEPTIKEPELAATLLGSPLVPPDWEQSGVATHRDVAPGALDSGIVAAAGNTHASPPSNDVALSSPDGAGVAKALPDWLGSEQEAPAVRADDQAAAVVRDSTRAPEVPLASEPPLAIRALAGTPVAGIAVAHSGRAALAVAAAPTVPASAASADASALFGQIATGQQRPQQLAKGQTPVKRAGGRWRTVVLALLLIVVILGIALASRYGLLTLGLPRLPGL